MSKIYLANDPLPIHRLTDDGIVLWKGPSHWTEPTHTHEFLELVYTFSGTCTHKINDDTYQVSRGDLLLINFNQTHSYEPQGEFIFCNILIQPGFLDQELIHSINAMDLLGLSVFLDFSSDMQVIQPFTRFIGEDRSQMEQLINQMVQEFEQRNTGYLSMLRAMMTQLLILLFRRMRGSPPYSELLEQVGILSPQILQYIEENCAEKITLTELAKRSCYNPAYFSRIFKKCFGINFTDFVQEKRIEKAKQLLIHSKKSISEVALEVGYQDRKQFYAAFSKYNNGQTPGEYRKS